MKLLRCNSCKAIVIVEKDCNCPCGFECCDEKMEEIVPNSVDAAVEKHVPNYEINDNKISEVVNHVMEDEHYIEWIALETDNMFIKKEFKPGEEAKAVFDYVPGSTLYAYCNKHSLWKKDVE